MKARFAFVAIAQYGFESKKDASLSSASKATVLSTYLKLLPNSFEIAPINALLCKIVANIAVVVDFP
jgi:hypothetical protein